MRTANEKVAATKLLEAMHTLTEAIAEASRADASDVPGYTVDSNGRFVYANGDVRNSDGSVYYTVNSDGNYVYADGVVKKSDGTVVPA